MPCRFMSAKGEYSIVKIVIHGAGAIGCFVGGAWAAAGLDVTLVGRDYVAETVKKHGMTLTDYQGFSANLPIDQVRFSTDAKALQEADIIGLSVKSVATESAGREIKQHARPGAIVVSPQNGISNVSKLRELLPDQTVLAGMVPFNVVAMEQGRWHKGTLGILMADHHPALSEIVEKTAGGPAALELRHDMTSVAWGKLLLNLNNAINALSGQTLYTELSDRNYRRVLAACISEALAVLAAADITPAKVSAFPPRRLPKFVGSPNFIFNTIGLKLQKIDKHARSSMADDFEAGRKTEIDFLNGEVVRLAADLGISAPANEKIVALVKKAEEGNRQAWTGADLSKEVLG